MTVHALVVQGAYAALTPATHVAARWLPRNFQHGRRACDALSRLRPLKALARPRFSRAVLASRWHSAFLLAYLRRLTCLELAAFLEARVHASGVVPWELPSMDGRPLILVTPHYGECVLGCLAAAHWLRSRRPLAAYYERRDRNDGIGALFGRAATPVETLDAGLPGIRRAMKILRGAGCVAMMPDVYLDVAATIAVPFLGRWLRAPTGAAFLALRSDAVVVPAYAVAGREMRVDVRFSNPIDGRTIRSGDEAQDRFMLTCLIFADIERTIRRAPEHWLQWEWLPRISTPLDLPETFSLAEIRAALAHRCAAAPGLLRRVPELRELLLGDARGGEHS